MEFQKEKYINPFTDYGFKRLFGEEWSKDILLDFLNELLVGQQGKIKNLTYLKTTKLGTSEESRKAVFDLYCENDAGEKFIVELQKAKQKYFKDRTIYYSAFPIREQAKTGKEWSFELKAVYTIAILDFEFDESTINKDKYRYDVKLVDISTGKVFYDKLTYIYLETPKFKKKLQQLSNRFEKWMYLFRNLNSLDKIPDKLREKIFEKVFELAEIARFSPEEVKAYEDSLNSYRDLKNSIDTAREEGLKEGIRKGIEQGVLHEKRVTVIKSYEAGLPLNTIANITNLPIEMIESIINEG